MGEIADMMLDGTLCECCGEFIGEDLGFPGYCSAQCAKDRGVDFAIGKGGRVVRDYTAPPMKKVRCPVCSKSVKVTGLKDHQRDVHGLK